MLRNIVIMVESKHVECYGPLGPLRDAIKFEKRRKIRNSRRPGYCVGHHAVSSDYTQAWELFSLNVPCVPQRTPVRKKILNVESIHNFKSVTGKFCIQFHFKKWGMLQCEFLRGALNKFLVIHQQ